MMLVEVPGQGIDQGRDLRSHPALGERCEDRRSRSPSINAFSIARPDTPKMSDTNTDNLIPASLNLEMIMKSTFGGAGCGRWSGH